MSRTCTVHYSALSCSRSIEGGVPPECKERILENELHYLKVKMEI